MKGHLSNAHPRKCLVCGEDFIPIRNKQWFCSPPRTCRQTNKAKQLIRQMAADRGDTLEPRSCQKCGNTFHPKASDQKTCGAACPGPPAQVRTCANPDCGQSFTVDRIGPRGVGKGNQRFCSRNCRDRHADWRMRQRFRRYDITPEQYQEMVKAQENRCMICGEPPSPPPNQTWREGDWALAVDHAHATGKRRDLLCHRHNLGLGLFDDDPRLLRAAAAYIERHKAKGPAEARPLT